MPTYFIDPVNGNDANDGLGWWKIAYTAGQTAAPGVGVTITGAGGATGIILSVVLSSGTWAGNNAAGTFYLYGRNGTAFANGENITWTGGSATNAQGTPYDAVYSSFKTVKKTFAAGDTIKVAKSPETAAAGTVTATVGSNLVQTTNDLTGVIAQYTVVRIGGDDNLYMVKSRTSSVITLYRPYRGATAAGKALTYFTGMPNSTSNDWQPTSMPGTSANRITIIGGVSLVNNTQDGFTILYGNNTTYCFNGTYAFTDISRMATLYWSYPWNAAFNDGTWNLCFGFRSTQMGLAGSAARGTGNFVSEMGKFGLGFSFYGCNFDIETSDPASNGFTIGVVCNSIFKLLNAQATSGNSYPAVLLTGPHINDVKIIDSIFDELGVGGTNIFSQGQYLNVADLFIQNPTFGAGAIFANGATYGGSGSVKITNIGGLPNHRTYMMVAREVTSYALLQNDPDTYHTAAPSAKMSLFQGVYPYTITHLIPCDAGVQKTVSVYFRKNSSYGSVTRPTMRLRWVTGSAGALVSNVHDEVMADTDDTFLQVSYAVTPSVVGAIIMELIFQSSAAGAIAWYDDIGVA